MGILEQPLANYFKWNPFPSIKVPNNPYKPFTICEPKKKIGIEVEVENVPNASAHMDPHIWTIKTDGSLRNNGIEYVTYPICDQEIVYAVNTLFERLPARAEFSERTSIHIHVNVREQTIGQLLSICLLYTVFEQLLFQFAGAHRVNNIFCVPIQQTRYPFLISDVIKTESIFRLIRSWKKYSGLNLHSISTLGSVEYRIMEGHRDTNRLLNWINILLRLHRAARRIDYAKLFKSVSQLNITSHYEQFIYEIFEQDAVHLMLNNDNLKNLLEFGVSIAKSFAVETEFFDDLTVGISNTSNLARALELQLKQDPIDPVTTLSSKLDDERAFAVRQRMTIETQQLPVEIAAVDENEVVEDEEEEVDHTFDDDDFDNLDNDLPNTERIL